MTAKTFDLKQVDVEVFLDELDIRNIEILGDEVRFSCPFPEHSEGDQNPSAYMNADHTAWYCHGCKRKGNAVTFLSDLFNFSHTISTGFIREKFGQTFVSPNTTLLDEIEQTFMEAPKPTINVIQTYDSTMLDKFEMNWIYVHPEHPGWDYMVLKRHFHFKVLQQFQIGWDQQEQRVTIPVFDDVGRLVGIKGRRVDGEKAAKYKVMGGSKYAFDRYNPSLIVYGLDKVQNKSKLILMEGELNVLAMHQMGFTNAVCIGGSTFTAAHAKVLRSYADEVTLFFDSDDPGHKAAATACDLLEPHMQVLVTPDHDNDPAGYMLKDKFGTVQKLLSSAESSIMLLVDED